MSVYCVKEKEAIVIERLGMFKDVLKPGPNFIVPFLDRPKVCLVLALVLCLTPGFFCCSTLFPFPLFLLLFLVSLENQSAILRVWCSWQLDSHPQKLCHHLPPEWSLGFPQAVCFLSFWPRSRNVITRDNASIFIDAVLQYRITNPKLMVYSVQNLPNLLSKMLQAEVFRNLFLFNFVVERCRWFLGCGPYYWRYCHSGSCGWRTGQWSSSLGCQNWNGQNSACSSEQIIGCFGSEEKRRFEQ